jgi:GTP-binding protein HflX
MNRDRTFDLTPQPERAFLIAVDTDDNDGWSAEDSLAELASLADTAGAGVVGAEWQRRRHIDPNWSIGKGKAQELLEAKDETGFTMLIADDELSPKQQKALEELLSVKVLDRSGLILDIFAQHARTHEGRLQVELAQLETDRRVIRARIKKLKERVEHVRQQRETTGRSRDRRLVPSVAIVGYTNAGKSSLLNALSGSEIYAEDKLFATLDPTTRRIDLPDGQPMLLTDTVGFVRNLPHRLVEAFKATLEEAVLADFLIHVLDATAPEVDQHYQTTIDVLTELGATDKRTVVVLNKIDLLKGEEGEERLHELRREFGDKALFVSVKGGIGLDALIDALNDFLLDRVTRMEMRIPQARQDLIALIRREGKIIGESYEGNDVLLTAVIPNQHCHLFEDFVAKKAEV